MNSRKNAPERRAPFPPASLGHRHERIGPTSTLGTPLKVTAIGCQVEPSLKEYVHRHTGFKLGKFALHIQGIEICLKDEGGPRSGPKYSCVIKTAMEREGEVIVDRCCAGIQAAFDLAVDVAERTIRRLLQRRRTLERVDETAAGLLPIHE